MNEEDKFNMLIDRPVDYIELEGMSKIPLIYPSVKESVNFFKLYKSFLEMNKIIKSKNKAPESNEAPENVAEITDTIANNFLLPITDYLAWCIEKHYNHAMSYEEKTELELKLLDNLDIVFPKILDYLEKTMPSDKKNQAGVASKINSKEQ